MRYANITSIPSSYIVAFFSSLGDASPPSEDALLAGEDASPAHLYIYYFEFLIVLSVLHATLIVHLNKEESTRSYLI